MLPTTAAICSVTGSRSIIELPSPAWIHLLTRTSPAGPAATRLTARGHGGADRDLRLRFRRSDSGPGGDRPAAARGHRLPRRHGPVPLRRSAHLPGPGVRAGV